MKKHIRIVLVAAIAAIILLAAANIGGARTLTPNARQVIMVPCADGQRPTPAVPCLQANLPDCAVEQQPTPEAPCMPPNMPNCAVGAQPTAQVPCVPSGGQGGGQGGQNNGQNNQNGQNNNQNNQNNQNNNQNNQNNQNNNQNNQNNQNNNQNNQNSGQGGQGGGGFNYGNLKACDPGVTPTSSAPCKYDMQVCAEGQKASPQKPCRPGGTGEGGGEAGKEGDMGGFDAPPTTDIKKEMQNKYMVINISTEGAGDKNGSLDVTFVKVVSGVKKATMEYLNDQLVGESFVIQTSAKTKCFADTADADKIPDLVSCKELDEAADNSPGSIKSQFRGKIKFNAATYEPEFTAEKVIFLKGSFNVAEIG